MTTPFFRTGRRLEPPARAAIDLGGDEYISINSFIFWSRLSPTVTLQCGGAFEQSVTGTVSVTETNVSEITSNIGSKLVAKDLAELNSSLSAKLSRSVSIQLVNATSISVKKTAPVCGRSTVTFWELIRQFEFRHGHYVGFFNQDFVEDVYRLDVPAGEIYQETDQAEVVPACGCARNDKVGYYFKSRLEFGDRFAMSLPARPGADGGVTPLDFGGRAMRFGESIAVEDLPEAYAYVRAIVPPGVAGRMLFDGGAEIGLAVGDGDVATAERDLALLTEPRFRPVVGTLADAGDATDPGRRSGDCGPPSVTAKGASAPNPDRAAAVREAARLARRDAKALCDGNCEGDMRCAYVEASIETHVAKAEGADPPSFVCTATTRGSCRCE